MDASIVNVLVGLVGISVICTVLVQVGKELVPSREDAGGNETGPRRYLAPAILICGTLLGVLVGFLRRDYMAPDGRMLMGAWAIAGFIVGAASVGLYGGLHSLFPNIFGGQGWIRRREE